MNREDATVGMKIIYTGCNKELIGRTGVFCRIGENPKVRFDEIWDGQREWNTSYAEFSPAVQSRTVLEILNS